MCKGYPKILRTGDVFWGKVIDKASAYRFKCRFLDKKMHPLPVWKVSMPYDIEKIQMREFVRIDAMVAVYIQNMPNGEDVKPLKLFTKDISGGGLQLVAREKIKIGSKLQMNIEIPDFETINAIGEVVRVEQPQADNLLFWIGIRFLDIQEKDRNKIIKFVFKKELEIRRKEI